MKYRILPLNSRRLYRTADLLEQYDDARLDFVDLTIIALAKGWESRVS